MIWIVGSRGMLGRELSALLAERGVPFVGSGREVDVADIAALESFEAGRAASWIVNCAAYTAVDKAESEAEAARALNVAGPRNLARIAAGRGAGLIHVSTDYVFSGEGRSPYLEDDAVSPIGVYTATKADGEREALSGTARAVVIRTSWMYGRYGPSFVFSMQRNTRKRDEIRVVADQSGSPTRARDLAEAIAAIAGSRDPKFGIYHYSNAGEATWFDFACETYRDARALGMLDHEYAIRPIATSEYPTTARRPAYSVLSKVKIIRDYRFHVPNWKTSLSDFFDDLLRDPKESSAYLD